MNLPGVSMICPTYARFPARGHLLAECVESFRLQTYPGPKELLILNDAPTQTLVCDVPGVRVVNLLERLPTLGHKYNLLVRLARYDLLAPAEDDDVSLPNRLSVLVEMLGDKVYANPKSFFYLPSTGKMEWKKGGAYSHNASIYRRSAWEAVGGYPLDCRQDAGYDGRLRKSGLPIADGPVAPERTSYVYRFGVSDHHVSAYPDPEAAYLEYGKRPVAAGIWRIEPGWQKDYVSMTRDAIAISAVTVQCRCLATVPEGSMSSEVTAGKPPLAREVRCDRCGRRVGVRTPRGVMSNGMRVRPGRKFECASCGWEHEASALPSGNA